MLLAFTGTALRHTAAETDMVMRACLHPRARTHAHTHIYMGKQKTHSLHSYKTFI